MAYPHTNPGSEGFLKMMGEYPGRHPKSGGPRVQHNVLFEMQADEDTIVDWFQNTLKPSVENLPGVIEWNYGPYNSFEGFNKTYNWGMSFKFEDQYSRDFWIVHKDHEDGINKLMPLLKNGPNSVVAFDHLLPVENMVSTIPKQKKSCVIS
mmetsp:Transcript_9538/g.17904  ORF Transcript_9538/g.17904 Transcript_9538/m.17904 type:complete len:151 (+) Transcript_9538:50-502(+)